MILSRSKDFNANYAAKIIEIQEFHSHSNPEVTKLKCCKVDGFNVITGIDSEPGLYIYFPVECCISKEFLGKNNLFRDAALNVDHSKTGMFEDKGRVKAIRLKGEISEGFIIPVESLSNLTGEGVVVFDYDLGIDFDTVDGILLCKKYVPKIQRTPGAPGSKKGKQPKKKAEAEIVEGQFHFHVDTTLLKKCPYVIKPDSLISISSKVHGCIEASTPIETSEGIFTIKDIVESRKNVLIKAFDIKLNEITWVPIDDYYMIPDDGDWYEIELEDGRKLTITGNNPVWLPELNCYRRVDELDGSEKLLIS